MTRHARDPQAFILADEDDDKAGLGQSVKTVTGKPRKGRSLPRVEFAPEPADTPLVVLPRTHDLPPARRFRWSLVLVSALFSLFTMWVGLATVETIEAFFARNVWLGSIALAIAIVAGVAAIAIILREIFGLWRLDRIEHIQEKAARAINLDEQAAAQETVRELTRIYDNRSDLALGLRQLESHSTDILDPRDRVRLAETLLIDPLDKAAHKVIAKRAKRVTLLTTVTPAAALDMLFAASQNLAMLREIATLYGGRPSTLATLRLGRMVLTHLAVTGGLALSDNLIQHFVGKGLLGKLSARFGEGAVNGILTSRVGLAAIDVCRPIPQESTHRETLGSLLRELLSFDGGKDKHADSQTQP